MRTGLLALLIIAVTAAAQAETQKPIMWQRDLLGNMQMVPCEPKAPGSDCMGLPILPCYDVAGIDHCLFIKKDFRPPIVKRVLKHKN